MKETRRRDLDDVLMHRQRTVKNEANVTDSITWLDDCSAKASQLRFDYDATTIRRCHDAFDNDESDRNYELRSIRLRYDYDTTTTKN